MNCSAIAMKPKTFSEYTLQEVAQTYAALPVCCGGVPEMLGWDFVPRCSICGGVFPLSLPPKLLSELKRTMEDK